ncbi:MAG: hypothetical protein ACI4B3_01150 [Prevotella sp.]
MKAPSAQKVQIDLGKLYDMKKGADGVWTCVTEPQSEGFHYYFLVVDGVKVADPASESFYGCSMMTSGVEILYPVAKADNIGRIQNLVVRAYNDGIAFRYVLDGMQHTLFFAPKVNKMF